MDENSFLPILAMIDSMTPKERNFQTLLICKERIALGSGNDISEVNKLAKQFNQTKNDETHE